VISHPNSDASKQQTTNYTLQHTQYKLQTTKYKLQTTHYTLYTINVKLRTELHYKKKKIKNVYDVL